MSVGEQRGCVAGGVGAGVLGVLSGWEMILLCLCLLFYVFVLLGPAVLIYMFAFTPQNFLSIEDVMVY